MRCGNTNSPAPKLFKMLPSGSSLWTGAQLEPAQLSYWNGEAPGGTSGLAPQRSTTQSERPSLSTATPFSAPHLCPSGSLPQGTTLRYGLGRSLVGVPSHFHAGVAHPPIPKIRDRPQLIDFRRAGLRTVPSIAFISIRLLLFQKQSGYSTKFERYARRRQWLSTVRGNRHENHTLRRPKAQGAAQGRAYARQGHESLPAHGAGGRRQSGACRQRQLLRGRRDKNPVTARSSRRPREGLNP